MLSEIESHGPRLHADAATKQRGGPRVLSERSAKLGERDQGKGQESFKAKADVEGGIKI